ncbi:MAG: DNA repair protein RecN [Gammaproteobacteria bacterium]|jgi:DNA repair protein RecN (Recombination protein N)|nr:DNA repair protein RecN [Gammaproteobacteria bacterium]
MLVQLDIQDYALIDRLELAFNPGFTVLTGETGAGKSILIGALSLAFGDRADSGVIREGAKRAEVAATVRLSGNDAALEWLRDQDLDDGEECILRRVVGNDGRSRAWINGSTVPLSSLRALGMLLIDIHGQHEHHSLLQREHQGELLDGYARHPALLTPVEAAWREWKRLVAEARELEAMSTGNDGEVELLRYQARELDELAPAPGEWERLNEDHRRLSNAGELMETCRAGIAALHEDEDAIGDRLVRLIGLLRSGVAAEPGLAAAIELLETASVQLDEAAAELRAGLQRLDLDPERLMELDRRMATLHDAARKHRVAPADLPMLREELHQRLRRAEGAGERLAELHAGIGRAAAAWRDAAAALRNSRMRAATQLGKAVTREMRKLGMPEGSFAIELEAREDDQPSPGGSERALFLVSTNPGQAPKALARIASGGELSRVGLAIQMITSDQTGVPSTVFDEVDVGVGGGVAEIVGQGLRALGTRRQVLCITHLPQVAALGHQHLRVAKGRKGKSAVVTVMPLSRTERTEEIARMLGGIEISATTRAHAEEMISRAEQPAG